MQSAEELGRVRKIEMGNEGLMAAAWPPLMSREPPFELGFIVLLCSFSKLGPFEAACHSSEFLRLPCPGSQSQSNLSSSCT